MAKTDILLSICIPTFNRSAVLREALDSIVAEEAFLETDEVEVVISDNASTDDTAAVCADYVARYPGKVVYKRQEINETNNNFHHVLMLGRGLYMKLHNDTLLMRKGALRPYLDMIRDVADKRPVIAMTNGNRVREGKQSYTVCNNLDELVQNVSFFLTWIGGFGLWREDLPLARGFLHDSTQLAQVDIQCKLAASGRPALALFGVYFISKQDFRGTYNWAEVFGKNYLGILKKYMAMGRLSRPNFEQAKKEVLLRHVLPSYFRTTNAYDKRGFFDNLIDFHEDEYFHKIVAEQQVLIWRLSNPHNKIELGNVSAPMLLARVSAGNHSRGVLNVLGGSQEQARLQIGSLVTLGEDVSFVLGEPSPGDASFPNGWNASPAADGSITIGDDVWIGRGTRVLSGVRVGQGAIVEPYSVVTEDVPSYARVSGNPARLVSVRHEPAVVEKLCAFDFSALPAHALSALGNLSSMKIDGGNVDVFLQRLLAAGRAPAVADAAESGALAEAEFPQVENPEGEPLPDSLAPQRVPALLLLDAAGDAQKVADTLAVLAAGEHRDLPVIVLTTQAEALPEWTDSLRYLQVSVEEFADALEQLRVLPDFTWVRIIDLTQ